MNIDTAARILFDAYHGGSGYSRSWLTSSDRYQWKRAAEALLNGAEALARLGSSLDDAVVP